MDLTDIPDEAYDGGESPPDFSAFESPDTLLTGGSIRERLLDIVTAIRSPTKVSAIADRADCDTETARDYLAWFAEMGIVRRYDGRPMRYARNDAYFQWRCINRLHEAYSEAEIVELLSGVLDDIDEYRDQFDADSPDEVSLVEASETTATEAAWEALSEWETLERRAALLDAARRGQPGGVDTPRSIDV
ncbi:MAG: hypothetical protein J07HN4v3_02311 [Halonotius sp. J07HN4]|jgi:hypothetical protein|nr:MAG: hypothetical protein J07HN4v3_02311 [Halonotius sp. J07HN4]